MVYTGRIAGLLDVHAEIHEVHHDLHMAQGLEIARGLANYASTEARLICRKPSADIQKLLGYVAEAEMVHRDNLVLTR